METTFEIHPSAIRLLQSLGDKKVNYKFGISR